MKNLKISCTLVNDNGLDVDFKTGQDLIHHLAGEDINPPPRVLRIEALTDDGMEITIGISYDDNDTAHVGMKRRYF